MTSVLLQMSCRIQKRKKFENRQTFRKVTNGKYSWPFLTRNVVINVVEAERKRKSVCFTARKRATYDMFGEEGLKDGIPVGSDDSAVWTSGYTFHGDADRVFRDFFGGDNPFQGVLMTIIYYLPNALTSSVDVPNPYNNSCPLQF